MSDKLVVPLLSEILQPLAVVVVLLVEAPLVLQQQADLGVAALHLAVQQQGRLELMDKALLEVIVDFKRQITHLRVVEGLVKLASLLQMQALMGVTVATAWHQASLAHP